MSDLVPAVAAWGLPTAHRLPTRPLDDDGFDALVSRCAQHRVLGLLGSAVRAGTMPVTPTQHAALEAAWQQWLAHAVRVERLALDVIDTFDRRGIRVLLLKGPALAHGVYADPAERLFGDVDLLVEPGRLHDAGTTLVADLGGNRAEPELVAGFDDRFGRELLVRVHEIEVDLHRTFVNGVYGMRIDLPALFTAPGSVQFGTRVVPALSPTDRVLHAAYGSVLSDWPPRLAAVRDLAQAVAHDAPDPEQLRTRAAAWRGDAVLAAAVRQTWSVLALTDRPPLLTWARHHRAGRADRLYLRAAHGAARGYTGQLTALVAIPGVAARLAFLRAVAWPSREYREARHLGPLALLGAGFRRARRG